MAAFPTLAEMKAHLRITTSAEDTRLADVLAAVAEIMAPVVGGETVAQYTEWHDVRGSLLAPRHGPLVSVASLTPDRGTALDPALYIVDTELGVLRLRFMARGRYALVLNAGWSNYPHSLKEAAKIVCQHEWQVRNGNGGRPSPDMDALAMLPGSGYLVPHRAYELMQPNLVPGFA